MRARNQDFPPGRKVPSTAGSASQNVASYVLKNPGNQCDLPLGLTIVLLGIQGVQKFARVAIAKDQNIGVMPMWQILNQGRCRSIAEGFKLFAKRD